MAAEATTANKEIVRRLTQVIWTERDAGAVEELFAPDFVAHRSGRVLLRGAGEMRRFVQGFAATWADARWTNEDLIAAGDRVVARWSGRGVPRGEVRGVPPTGEAVTITGISIYRIADGRIAEAWVEEDWLGFFQQLGAYPPIPAPAPAGR